MLSFEDLGAENWSKYSGLILQSELVYPETIRSAPEDFIEILSEGDRIAKVAFTGSEYVGNVIGYCITPEEMKAYGLEGEGDRSKIAYIINIVVAPQHQGKGFGTELLREFIKAAKARGYEKLVGHFRQPNSLNLIKRLGAKEKGVFRNWENTGEDYTLCFLDLQSVRVPVPVQVSVSAPVPGSLSASLSMPEALDTSMPELPELGGSYHLNETLHANIKQDGQ